MGDDRIVTGLMTKHSELIELMKTRSGRTRKGCRVWLGARHSAGYGVVKRGGEYVYLHRASYEHHHGPIPEGHEVMHTCDNPPCWEPGHLVAGTHGDNMADMHAKGRGSNGADRSEVSRRGWLKRKRNV
jgi:hypothetical protein